MLDPDPGSLIQDLGSRILEPGSWIQDPGSMMDPGSWITDPGSRILDQDHLECHTSLAKSMKKRDTSSVLTDNRCKSLKTLGASHFSC